PMLRTGFRRVFAWGAAHAVLLVPTALYIATIQFYGVASTESWMKLPDVSAFLGDLVGDDFVGMTYQFWGRADTLNQVLPESISLLVGNASDRVGVFLSLVFLGLLLHAAWAVHARSPWLEAPGSEHGRRWLLFLLLWAFLPPLILLGL